ncbi:Mth938-like domain-containing protein [bacterium]|nr:Mth938-like domain-containing protein [bacterium]
MFEDPQGPIERFEWGRFQVDGTVHSEDGEGVGKDICILHGAVLPWDARQGHRLKPTMLAVVTGAEVDVLVIGAGVYGRMKVPKRTIRAAEESGIGRVIVEKTEDACETYNALARTGEKVALLAHGTC